MAATFFLTSAFSVSDNHLEWNDVLLALRFHHSCPCLPCQAGTIWEWSKGLSFALVYLLSSFFFPLPPFALVYLYES